MTLTDKPGVLTEEQVEAFSNWWRAAVLTAASIAMAPPSRPPRSMWANTSAVPMTDQELDAIKARCESEIRDWSVDGGRLEGWLPEVLALIKEIERLNETLDKIHGLAVGNGDVCELIARIARGSE